MFIKKSIYLISSECILEFGVLIHISVLRVHMLAVRKSSKHKRAVFILFFCQCCLELLSALGKPMTLMGIVSQGRKGRKQDRDGAVQSFTWKFILAKRQDFAAFGVHFLLRYPFKLNKQYFSVPPSALSFLHTEKLSSVSLILYISPKTWYEWLIIFLF